MIKQNESLLLKLVDNANVLFVFVDPQEKINICNRKIEEFSLHGNLPTAASRPKRLRFYFVGRELQSTHAYAPCKLLATIMPRSASGLGP